MMAGQWWRQVADKIDDFEKLEDGWDGQGAPAVHKDAVAWARKAAVCMEALRFPTPQRVMAGVGSTIHFEWWDFAGHYISVEASEEGLAAFCNTPPTP